MIFERSFYREKHKKVLTLTSVLSINQPLGGTDWYSVRESVNDAVNKGVDEVNKQIASLT